MECDSGEYFPSPQLIVPTLKQVVDLKQVCGVHVIADHGLDEVEEVF